MIVMLTPIALTPEGRLPALVRSDMWRMVMLAKVKILILNLSLLALAKEDVFVSQKFLVQYFIKTVCLSERFSQ